MKSGIIPALDIDNRLLVGIDCEGSPDRPWSAQISLQAGMGYMIRATDTVSVNLFRDWLYDNRDGILVSLHYATLNDFAQLRTMGIDITGQDIPFVDTGILAYLLAVEPGGLKALCFRHAGMHQDSYDDLIGNVGHGIAMDYLRRVMSATDAPWVQVESKPAKKKRRKKSDPEPEQPEPLADPEPEFAQAWPDPEPEIVEDGNGTRLKKSQGVSKLVPRIIADIESGKTLKDGSPVDPRDRWGKLNDSAKAPVIEAIGDMPVPTMDDIPLERAIAYGCRDADAQYRITRPLIEKVKAMDLAEACRIDHGIVPMIVRMAEVGIKLAPAEFWDALGDKCDAQMSQAKWDIYQETGRDINPGSGDQVAELLYGPVTDGGLGLTPPRMTDGGESGKVRGSTDDKCLEELLPLSPIVEYIEDYREASKLLGTYVEPLRQMATTGDGRARATFKLTRQVTGRITTAEPMNLLSIPVRSELGAQCRYGFIAPDGKIIHDADLCIAEGTTVDTPCGPVAIEKLNPGDIVFGYGTDRPNVTRVSKRWFSGNKECFRVTLDTGEFFCCTGEHKIGVLGKDGSWGLERLKNLEKGSRLLALHRVYAQDRFNLYGHKATAYKKQCHAVAEVVYGPRPEGCHVHHRDGDPTNDRPENLEYKLAADHIRDHEPFKNVNKEIRIERLREAIRDRDYNGENNPRWGFRKGPQLRCTHCDKEFYSPPCTKAKYCSKKCSDAANSGDGSVLTKPKPELTCLMCRNPFRVSRAYRAKRAKFCSMNCSIQAKKTGLSAHPKKGKRKLITFTCLFCGEESTKTSSNVGAGMYCSVSCSRAAKKTGLNHKIVSIQPCGILPTWDIEVEADNHVFALTCGVIVSNSTVEMRTFAHLSRDKRLCEIFIKGHEATGDDKLKWDVHTQSASNMFGVSIPQVEKYQRQAGKVINFFTINGGTAFGLRIQMIKFRAYKKDGSRWSEDDCQDMLDAWYQIYSGARRFQNDCIEETRATGLARDPLSGRIRYLPQIWSPINKVRAEAERCSFAHLIQTSANTILKRAMMAMWDVLRNEPGVEPLLPVHDEVLHEVPDNEETKGLVDDVVTWALTSTTDLIVPIEAEGGFGPNWGEAKH